MNYRNQRNLCWKIFLRKNQNWHRLLHLKVEISLFDYHPILDTNGVIAMLSNMENGKYTLLLSHANLLIWTFPTFDLALHGLNNSTQFPKLSALVNHAKSQSSYLV